MKGNEDIERLEYVVKVLASESKRRADNCVAVLTNTQERLLDELLTKLHCPEMLLMERVFKLLAKLWLKAKTWKVADEADWVIVKDSSRSLAVMNVLELKGSVERTVELIVGGVARVSEEETVIPAELARAVVFVLEVVGCGVLLLKQEEVPPIDENPAEQGVQTELA